MKTINAYVKFKTSATDGTETRLILRNVTRQERHRGFDSVARGGTAEFEIDGLEIGTEYVWTFVSCDLGGAVQFEEHGRITVYRKKYSSFTSVTLAENGENSEEENCFGGAVISGNLIGCQVLNFAVR
jgi:hypothetical protein